jgi:hypothetical protein
VPIAERGQVVIPAGWTLVVASSGVHADKTRSAKEAYNRLAREAAALLRLWNGSGPAAPSLHAALHSHPDAADRLRTLVAERDAPAARAVLERRLSHFLREDPRAAEAAQAFAGADADRLGALADTSRAEAESLLGNQVPEATALAGSARGLGALGASSFGTGFRGQRLGTGRVRRRAGVRGPLARRLPDPIPRAHRRRSFSRRQARASPGWDNQNRTSTPNSRLPTPNSSLIRAFPAVRREALTGVSEQGWES